MISKLSIAKALLDKAQAVCDDNTITLVPYGKKFESGVNDTYIREFPIINNDESIGYADDSKDIQLSVYQLTINTPKSNDGGRWQGLSIAEIMQAAFHKGLELTHNGQMLRIKTQSKPVFTESDTHFTCIISFNFSVIN